MHVALICVGMGCLDSLRYHALGCLRGEPSFEGMPASYYADYLVRETQPGYDMVAFCLACLGEEAGEWWALSKEREWSRCLRMMDQPEGVPVQRWLAQHSDAHVRYSALLALGKQGRAAKSAADVARAHLADNSPPCRLVAAYALARVDPSREREALRLLVLALREPGDRQTEHAAAVLEVLSARDAGPDVREALPELIKFAKEPDGEPTAHTMVQQLVWRVDYATAYLAGVPDADGRVGRSWPFANWVVAVAQGEPWPRLASALAAGWEISPRAPRVVGCPAPMAAGQLELFAPTNKPTRND
jgi:hypothetical protein